MHNTINLDHPRRKALGLPITLFLIYSIIFIVMLPLVVSTNKNTFNGLTTDVVGVVEKVTETEDAFNISISNDKTQFTTASLNIDYDWQTLIGKTVTLTVPEKTYGDKPTVQILGVKFNGQTIVDAETTIEVNRAENEQIITVLAIVAAILCTATCAFTIWRINTPRYKAYPLSLILAQFYSKTQRQPSYGKRQAVLRYMPLAYVILGTLFILIIILTLPTETTFMIIIIVTAALLVAILIAHIILDHWSLKKDIKHYVRNFPFDNTNLSAVSLRATVKEQLRENLKKERELHPDTFQDNGNYLKATFTEDGVEFTDPEIPDDEEPDTDPFAEKIASEFPDEQNIPEDPFQDTNHINVPSVKIGYDKLNFEALAFYFKRTPMVVVIKSRMDSVENLPEEIVMENDVHIVLDSNLLKTLDKFNVHVENLQNILDNKEQLMNSHCFRLRPNK